MSESSEVKGAEAVILNSRNAKIKERLKYFDEDANDYNFDNKNFLDYTEKSIPILKSSEDKLLSINNIIDESVLTLSGYVKEVKRDSIVFKQKNLPLTNSDVIKTFHAILEPFGSVSNILGKKDWDVFKIQVESSWKAFYKFCIHSRAKPKTNTRTVYREFQSCIVNIGDILCDNPDNMRDFWGKMRNDHPEDNLRDRY